MYWQLSILLLSNLYVIATFLLKKPLFFLVYYFVVGLCMSPLQSNSFPPPQQVRYLKIIEKSGYQALPWVRYITQNGGRSEVQ